MNRCVFFVICSLTAALAAQQTGPAFDVASIKRNIGLRPRSSGTMQSTPKGEIRMVWVPARMLVLRAYPVDVADQVVGLPSWADSERYDVTVKGSPDATPDEVRQMWQTLLAERMKLVAHYEERGVRGYNLVIARSDGRLGPSLKPSTLDCSAPDPTKPPPQPSQPVMDAVVAIRRGGSVTAESERLLMSQCRGMIGAGNTTYAGGVDMAGLILELRLGGIREPIEDRTGLEGLYSFKLTYSKAPLGVQVTPNDDLPSIFTALQEQLGLKLESTTLRSRPVVVVDHIERPTGN